MFGMAVLALASCSKSSDVYDPTASKDRAQYEQAFINAFGTPASNQDWGFGTSSYTRAATTSRAAGDFGFTVSNDYSATFSKAYFDAIQQVMPEGGPTTGNGDYEFLSTGSFDFSFIFSRTSASDEIGYYYYKAEDGIASRTEVMIKSSTDSPVNYYQCQWSNGSWESPGEQAGFDIWSWGATQVRAKVITINVPAGYRVGFYIENKSAGYPRTYSNRSLNADGEYYSAVVEQVSGATAGTFLVGLEDWKRSEGGDNDCNDIIMSVNKGTTPPVVIDPSEPDPVISGGDDDEEFNADVRIMAEDLNASEKSDFDFNDVVFDVQWIDGGAKIRIMAAGGTYPLRINGEDALEVHGLFNVSTKTMVNTFSGQKTRYASVIKTITGNFINSSTNENDASLIKVEVNKGTGYIELTAPTGKVASKLCVDPKVDWCDEYQDIDEKWSGKFTEYVGGKISQFWN